MAANETAEILNAIAAMISALAWPTVTVVVLRAVAPELRKFLSGLGEISIDAAGIKASLKKSRAEATAALSAAVASKASERSSNGNVRHDTAELVEETVTPDLLERARAANLLWVDDNPSNNRYELRALRALGLTIETSTSTEDALKRIANTEFDLIISDLGRPGDDRAGLTLLTRLRQMSIRTPYLIYASPRALAFREEARKLGAIDCTDRADELFRLVSTTLSRSN